MAELKTQKTTQSVKKFIASIEDDSRRLDCEALCSLMRDITGCEPVMWGSSIVGFDEYSYTYASGQSGNWPITAFSPRKQNLTIYITDGYDNYHALLEKLGPHTLGKSCLYLKRLGDVDMEILRDLIQQSVEYMRHEYPKKRA